MSADSTVFNTFCDKCCKIMLTHHCNMLGATVTDVCGHIFFISLLCCSVVTGIFGRHHISVLGFTVTVSLTYLLGILTLVVNHFH